MYTCLWRSYESYKTIFSITNVKIFSKPDVHSISLLTTTYCTDQWLSAWIHLQVITQALPFSEIARLALSQQ